MLGPLLFLIYINDIVNSTNLGELVLFADDTNIFICDEDESNLYSKANTLLSQIKNYMFCNQLHINLTKSVYMHFRPKRWYSSARTRAYGTENNLRLSDHTLERVTEVKFLGVIIDDELSWEPQMIHLKQKLNASINIIKRLAKFIPKSQYNSLYNSLFKSHLSYCISSWGGVSPNKLSKLFSIQKRCIRLLFGTKPTFDHVEYYQTCARVRTYQEHMSKKDYCLEHTKSLFNSNRVLSIHNLYVYHSFLELFKVMKITSPIAI